MSLLTTIVLATLSSAVFVDAVRRYAVRKGILDLPNARSSHLIATPRGGGAGIVIATLLIFTLATPQQSLTDWRLRLALLGVFPTAIAGWLDDQRGLTVTSRLCAHAASGLLLLPLALAPDQGSAMAPLLATGWILATLSAINVVNFIDGIDGLIGLQGVILGLHLASIGPPGNPGTFLGAAMAGACIGFLAWNWPPARIFLGDVGSGTLGLLAMIAGILMWQVTERNLVAIFLPALPIFLDAFLTICRRLRAREAIYKPHRSHLYQRLANGGWGHAPVSLAYGIAAATGAIVARTSTTSLWPATLVLYLALVIAAGVVLDRRLVLRRLP